MEPTQFRVAKFQELLASIYLSSSERNYYFASSEEGSKAYGLSQAALTQIAGTPKESVDFYARSLKRKRFQEILQFIPMTKRNWNGALKTAFDNYVETCIPSGPKKHIADLISFSEYVISQNQLSVEAKDCLRFELMPWDMNFELNEKEYVYKLSHACVRIVEAHRRVGLNFKTVFYKTRFSKLQFFDKDESMRRSNINSLGIYLKLPYLTKLLEWYLPLP